MGDVFVVLSTLEPLTVSSVAIEKEAQWDENSNFDSYFRHSNPSGRRWGVSPWSLVEITAPILISRNDAFLGEMLPLSGRPVLR
jgi:hypothetical protein